MHGKLSRSQVIIILFLAVAMAAALGITMLRFERVGAPLTAGAEYALLGITAAERSAVRTIEDVQIVLFARAEGKAPMLIELRVDGKVLYKNRINFSGKIGHELKSISGLRVDTLKDHELTFINHTNGRRSTTNLHLPFPKSVDIEVSEAEIFVTDGLMIYP